MTIQMEMGSSSLDHQEINKIGTMGCVDSDDDSFSSDVDESDDDSFDQQDDRSSSLANMSDLLQQLPSKRGLSKHFQGKSQSFTSLSKVTRLEDLVKPENPYNKKLKSCKSYVGLSRVNLPPPTRSASSSKLFKASSSRGSCSSSRPVPDHQSHSNGATAASGFSNQTPLFV